MNVLELLNQDVSEKRLEALKDICSDPEERYAIVPTDEVNNHVHTIYSFSPYSPTAAVYKAWQAGLKAVGCMDHDSVSGCGELMEACRIVGLGSTVGFELRVNFCGTAVEGYKLNSPDSENIGYIAVHGIPRRRLPEIRDFLKPLQQERNTRNASQVDNLNREIEGFGLGKIDFEDDVAVLSVADQGGTITERHILLAFCNKVIDRYGRGAPLVDFLKTGLKVDLPVKIETWLLDQGNPHYEYDLLGVLKSSFLKKIFIQPGYKECISVFEVVNLANSIGAIPVYAYLGDVTDSPTGDKKAEHFEDAYLDALIPEIKRIGFKGVTYMPPRNTSAQLKRIQKLCAAWELMEISGVDINSSRQEFNCPILLAPDFRHLVDATWALIAHEKCCDRDSRFGLFHKDNPWAEEPLDRRIHRYCNIGRSLDMEDPEGSAGKVIRKIVQGGNRE